jgi:hypothetical protein
MSTSDLNFNGANVDSSGTDQAGVDSLLRPLFSRGSSPEVHYR